MNGISALIKETTESSLVPCEDTVKKRPSITQEADPRQTSNLLAL